MCGGLLGGFIRWGRYGRSYGVWIEGGWKKMGGYGRDEGIDGVQDANVGMYNTYIHTGSVAYLLD